MYLINGGAGQQLIRRVSQDLLVGGAVVNAVPRAVYHCNHVGRVLRDQLK